MAQVSYGTITITDTTDIESIYSVYAGSENITTSPNSMDFNLWTTDITQVTGYYIWQRTVTKPYGIEITEENFQDYYSDPICITGAGGRSVESINTYYCNYGEGTPPEGYEGWQTGVPEYNIEKPNYWIKTIIIYTDNFKENSILEDNIVVFDNTNENQYIKSLKVTLEPIQLGSGTPSPTNIRPISGRTECMTHRTGKNMFDKEAVTTGKWLSTTTGLEETSSNYVITDYIPVEANETIFIPSSGSSRRWFYDVNKTPKTYLNTSSSQAFTPAENGYIRVTILLNGSGAIDLDAYQIEYGSTTTDYEPYQGNIYTTSLGQTVYGGILDVVSGELVINKGYIASYNDESLPSTWISDRDEYASDITPTVGAEVVYELENTQTYQLTQQEIQLLLGINSIWSDGLINLESVSIVGKDVQIYLDRSVTDALVQVQGVIEQVNELNSLNAKVKNHWWDAQGMHFASGINNAAIDTADSTTYGYIGNLGLQGLTFGYNNCNAIQLLNNTLTIYQPPNMSGIPTQGKRTVSLTQNALKFYNPEDGETLLAEFDGEGLKIYNTNNQEVPVASYGEEIIVGNKTDFHIEIGAKEGHGELGFYKDENNKIAYLSGDMLYINKSVVVTQMDIGQQNNEVDSFGQWSWKLHKNAQGLNNLNLKWIG